MRPDLLRIAFELSSRGETFVLATVIGRRPPSSAQLGDTALITLDGEVRGWLGGACTKSTIVREARAVLADGTPRLVVLSPDPEAEGRPGVRVLPMTCHSGGSVEIYLEPHQPPDKLLIFGATETALALARLGEVLGFRVQLAEAADEIGDFGDADPAGAGLYVIVATYGEHDEEALRLGLSLEPDMIALVAGRARFASVRDTLIAGGLQSAVVERVVSPAGLDIGARTPAEVALSILAQIVQTRRAESGEAARAAMADGDDVRTGAGVPGERLAGEPVSDPAGSRTAADPVCGMAVAIEAAPSAEHGGQTFYFCCPGCRARFLASPEEFAVTT